MTICNPLRFDRLDPRVQFSARESNADSVAFIHDRSITQEFTGRILRYRVTSLQYSKRRQRVKRRCRERQTFASILQLRVSTSSVASG